MSTLPNRCYVVHDQNGRILALAPIQAEQMREGVELGWQPVAGLHQNVSVVELTEEHTSMAPHELMAAFYVHLDSHTGTAHLRTHIE